MFGPAVFSHADGSSIKFHDDQRVIFAFGSSLVEERVHGGHHTQGSWPPSEHPSKPGQAMAAHIHQGSSAGLLKIIKPVAVRPGMFFTLTHLENFSNRPFID